jgi:3-oxoacyl-[acyl-carrier protein] reductase
MQQVLDDAQTKFQRVYALVNNAGITRDNLLMRMKDEEWDDIVRTNLTAVFRLCRICVRDMVRAREGRIVNVVPCRGDGQRRQTNYAATRRCGRHSASRLRARIGSRNVTVNCVHPASSTPT